MTASSMHKPGWRSRRRSRLSLVERAVPRLGRITASDDEARPAAEPVASTDAAVVDAGVTGSVAAEKSGSDGVSRVETGSDKPSDSPKEAAAPSTLAQNMSAGEGALDPVSEGGDRPGHAGTPKEGTNLQVKSSSVSPATATSTAGGRPSSLSRSDKSDKEKRSASDSEGGTGSEPSASRTSARDKTFAQTLELDWARLIDCGFVDPRDRSRPLSATMDDIIRALVRQSLSDQSSWRDRVILVTSPHERIGKTTAAINFAFGVTTISNHRSVLVDVDTGGAGAVDWLGGRDRRGIAQALVDDGLAIEDLVIGTDLDRLTLIASGTPDEDTLDRFASRRMLQILRHLSENKDTLLVIDAPPILESQEAAVLSVIAGQVVLAVEAGRTTGDQIEHALQRIGDRHNVSLVLTKNSGMASDSMPLGSGGETTSSAIERRRPGGGGKRRLPGSAAALTGAVILGLVFMGSAETMVSKITSGAGFQAISEVVFSPAPDRIGDIVMPLPQRRSANIGMPGAEQVDPQRAGL